MHLMERIMKLLRNFLVHFRKLFIVFECAFLLDLHLHVQRQRFFDVGTGMMSVDAVAVAH